MKKKLLITITIILLFALTAGITLLIKNKNMVKEIKEAYNEFVITNKEAELYKLEENYETIGQIKENIYLEIEKPTIKTKKDIYFKIKNTNYYINYKDINKTEKIEEEEKKEYYLNINKSILTNETTNFYENNELKITINESFEFDITKQDENYYYITFLNKTYQIKKDEIKELKDVELEPTTNYISILNYNKIEETCNEKDCVTYDAFKEQLNYLKENNYYSINIEDFKLWINDNINLKEKAILITSKQENINDIAKEYGLTIEQNFEELTYNDSNSKTEKGNSPIPRYNIINKTTIEIFKRIIAGETITYVEPKIQQQHYLPSESANATSIAVLNYHFFYDDRIGESCPDGNCKRLEDFEQELNFLKENNYKTLTMEEFTKWMYGEIELPARSVLITIDDGAMGTGTHNGNKLIPTLEKYNAHATLFLITGWWPIQNYSSPNLDIESHTFDMHEGNYCEGVPRGSKLLCSSKEQVYEDLSKSAEITGSKNAFCFPMYVYNDTTLQVLQEIGFKLAFVGGDTKATRNNDKYKIPRYHIYRTTTLDQFINMVS